MSSNPLKGSTAHIALLKEYKDVDGLYDTSPSGDTRTVSIEVITPERARRFLEMRPPYQEALFRKAKVRGLCRDIKNGRWINSWNTIGFDVNDGLINGQHTCQAIVEAGISVRMIVVRGLPLNAFKVGDVMRPRSQSQVRDAFGEKRGGELLTKAAHVIRQHKNGADVNSTLYKEDPTAQEIEEILVENDGLLESCEYAKAFWKRGDTGYKKEAVAAARHIIVTETRQPSPVVDRFFDELLDARKGLALSARDPIYLLGRKFERSAKKLSVAQTIHCFCKAWNLYVTGAERIQLDIPSRTDIPPVVK